MKKLIVNLILRFLDGGYYRPLSEKEVKSLFVRMATEEGFERLPDLIKQCADQYKNQYLYTGDKMYKGCVLSLTEFRSRIEQEKNLLREKKEKQRKVKKGEKLTKEKNKVNFKSSY